MPSLFRLPKIIFSLTLFIAIFVGASMSFKVGRVLITPKPVLACVNWCSPVCVKPKLDGSCDEWLTLCCDGVGGGGRCDAGEYSCNRPPNNCCPLGGGGGTCDCGVNAHGNCKPCGCDASKPVITAITKDGPVGSKQQSTIHWTYPVGGNVETQQVFASLSYAGVSAGKWCEDSTLGPCAVNKVLASNISSYSAKVFNPDTVYNWTVKNGTDPACNATSDIKTSISSCEITPDPVNIAAGQAKLVRFPVTFDYAPVVHMLDVNFSTTDTSIATVNANTSGPFAVSVATAQYDWRNTVRRTNKIGTTTLNANLTINNRIDCRATAQIGCTASDISAPVITSVTQGTTISSAKINWTRGIGGAEQRIYIGKVKSQVEGNCGAGSACAYVKTGIAKTATTLTTTNVLVAGTVYYIKIVNFDGATCKEDSLTKTYLSSCILSSPPTLKAGESATITASVNSSPEVTSVNFSSNNTSVAAVSPASDTTYQYKTTVTGVSGGPAIVSANAIVGGVATACPGVTVTVTQGEPWWQVKDSDLQTNGDITSKVPGGVYFDLSGPGGFPGVIAYGGAFSVLGSGALVSTTSWQANSAATITKVYDSRFFGNQIPDSTVINDADLLLTGGGTQSGDGYYWYRYNGLSTSLPFTISSSLDLGDRKAILLVDNADLNINGSINVNDGVGFFMAIAGKNSDGEKGNIVIGSSVGGGATPNLEGIYLADSVISTGTTGNEDDTKLYIRGSMTGYGGVALQRNLGSINNGNPSEFFEYAPDQIMLFPKKLSVRKINWKEVAP